MRRSVLLFVCLIPIFIIFNFDIVTAQEWSPPVRISGPCIGFYPKILSVADTLHVVYENMLNFDEICYVRSTNYGVTWSSPIVLYHRDFWTCVPQLMICGSRIICLCSTGTDTSKNIGYCISTNSGTTWRPSQNLFNPDLDCLGLLSCASAVDSLINITMLNRFLNPDICIYYNIRSTDFGQTWSNPIEIWRARAESGLADQISIGEQIHFVWSGQFSENFPSLYYCRSSDGGMTWLENLDLNNSDGNWGQAPTIAANSYGTISVAWEEGLNILLRNSFDSGETWEPIIQVTYDNEAWGDGDIKLYHGDIFLAWEKEFESDNWHKRAIIFNKSYDGGQSWEGEYWLDRDSSVDAHSPDLAVQKHKIFAIWNEDLTGFDSSYGLYFSHWPADPNSIDENNDAAIPNKPNLFSYPNPFNSSTTISFSNLQDAEIKIFDIKGALIKTLKANNSNAGSIIWNGTDNSECNITSGIYFARASGKNGSASIKLIYLK